MSSSFYTKKDQKILDELWTTALSQVQKSATESMNINDKINSILNNKNTKFSSVSDKVKDMMRRSGFEDFKNAQTKVAKVSNASENATGFISSNDIKIFKVCPEMIDTLSNICESSRGLLPIISIIGRLKDLYGNRVVDSSLWSDAKFLSYIANKNLMCKSQQVGSNGTDLGKIDTIKRDDPTAADVFHETKL